MNRTLFPLLLAFATATLSAQQPGPAWIHAAEKRGAMSADETRTFMKRLAQHAVAHHMKKAEGSPQRGMMYEYLRWSQRGQPGQFIQGEALDTMHDGTWFAVAMCNAYRATGDAFYKNVLVKWQLPFYLKMLNHGAELFSDEKVDVRPELKDTWKGAKEWLLQGRENGFVPYWWDDGESVSLEMLGKKSTQPFFPCTNEFAGQPNLDFRLKGYSHGSSNHLAQDLGVMLLQAWLVLHDSKDPADRDLAKQVALGAKNLQECRTRHGSGNIPACVAAYAVSNGDAAALAKLPQWDREEPRLLTNHYTKAVRDFTPGAKNSTPGFADDQIYIYNAAVARTRTMTRPLALKLAFDAFTHPLLWQLYSDDAPVPPGMNRFDLYPLNFIDGKPEHVRSQRKGPSGRPVPAGSRMGPQNMIVCALALQALGKGGDFGTIPEQIHAALKGSPGADFHQDLQAWLEREAGTGLRTWESVLDAYGYIPTGLGCNNAAPGFPWDEFSDTGGYAHLISAAAQWLTWLDGQRDWERW
jgi:hypothetical protein